MRRYRSGLVWGDGDIKVFICVNIDSIGAVDNCVLDSARRGRILREKHELTFCLDCIQVTRAGGILTFCAYGGGEGDFPSSYLIACKIYIVRRGERVRLGQ